MQTSRRKLDGQPRVLPRQRELSLLYVRSAPQPAGDRQRMHSNRAPSAPQSPSIRMRRAPTDRKPRRRGFTIAEMAVVLMIMGIFAAVAVPNFVDSMLFHRVESAARRVKADLELLRQTARRTSATQTMSLSNPNTYTLEGDISDLNRPGEPYVVDLQAEYQIDAALFDFDGETLVSFDGYGRPIDSVGQPFADDAVLEVTLTVSKHKCIVDLHPVTGAVKIFSDHDRSRAAEGSTRVVSE